LASNAFKYGCQPAERPTQYHPAREYISKSKIGIMKAPRRTVQPWCLGSWFICSAVFTRPRGSGLGRREAFSEKYYSFQYDCFEGEI
jgi:hypothetical protein